MRSSEVTALVSSSDHQVLNHQLQPAWRYVVTLPVMAVLLQGDEQRTLHNVALRNISYTGACLHSSQILPIGELVSIHFEIPESGCLFHAVAKVIWSDSHGQCGIQFQNVSAAHAHILREWLETKHAEATAVPVSPQTLPSTNSELVHE